MTIISSNYVDYFYCTIWCFNSNENTNKTSNAKLFENSSCTFTTICTFKQTFSFDFRTTPSKTTHVIFCFSFNLFTVDCNRFQILWHNSLRTNNPSDFWSRFLFFAKRFILVFVLGFYAENEYVVVLLTNVRVYYISWRIRPQHPASGSETFSKFSRWTFDPFDKDRISKTKREILLLYLRRKIWKM